MKSQMNLDGTKYRGHLPASAQTPSLHSLCISGSFTTRRQRRDEGLARCRGSAVTPAGGCPPHGMLRIRGHRRRAGHPEHKASHSREEVLSYSDLKSLSKRAEKAHREVWPCNRQWQNSYRFRWRQQLTADVLCHILHKISS